MTIAGRTIWALVGKACPTSGSHKCGPNGGGLSMFAVCCTADGRPSDLTPLLRDKTRADATGTSVGVDSHGGLWIAWLDGASSKPGVALKLARLDPQTLQPLSTKKLDHTLLYDNVGSSPFAFACAASCRLVYQGLFGAFSWDGGKPAKLWTNDFRRDRGGHLIGAGARGGGLDLVSWADKVPGVPDSGQRLSVQRGGPGVTAHAISSVDVPNTIGNAFGLQGVPSTIVTPNGVVALGFYMPLGSSPTNRVLDAVLRG